MKNNLIKTFLLCSCISANVYAQQDTKLLPAQQEIQLKYGADRLGKRYDKDMQRFRDNRLGLFIHWGLSAIPAGEWNGKMYYGAAEFLQPAAKISTEDWMAQMKYWNPTKLNPKAWAKMAKDMGVKYVKITTKHHDGFCIWPSKYSKYTVEYTPYKKDILGELVDAYQKEGIDVHLYFSVLDWNHPDYRSTIKTEEDRKAFQRFLVYSENQIKELATRYPTVKDFWFDGTWDQSIKDNGWWTAKIERMLKRMIPGVTINSRLRADDYGKRHFDSNGHMMGDYESGYERRLPDPYKDLDITTKDWEACMTIPENIWGYHKDWSASYVKNYKEVLLRIVHAASMGGNMVVNFGPTAEGDFRKEEVALAKEIGKWMKKNGECVYGCGYAGFEKQPWGYYTRKDANTVYMVVFNPSYTNNLTVRVPKGVVVNSAEMLNGKKVEVVEATRNEYNVCMPSYPKEIFVIKLKVENKNVADKYQDALI